jgi:hypothetical protein
MNAPILPDPTRLSFRGNLQVAWDSTSMRALKECPRKYYYSIVLGFAPRFESVHLTFGLHYHKGLELLAHYKAGGLSHDEAVCGMVKAMMVATHGWRSDDTSKNRETLIRTLVWYAEHFRDDPAETYILANGKPAVELSFRFSTRIPVGDSDETHIYCGHLDRVARFMEGIYVFDAKSTKSSLAYNYFNKFSPDTQMSGYTMGAKITWANDIKGVVIDATQVAVGFNRFERGMTLRSDDQLDEWYEGLNYYIKMAEGYAKQGYWPMNESSCGNYGGCPFQGVCSKAPRLRTTWLQADFHRRIWDPLVVRGDI